MRAWRHLRGSSSSSVYSSSYFSFYSLLSSFATTAATSTKSSRRRSDTARREAASTRKTISVNTFAGLLLAASPVADATDILSLTEDLSGRTLRDWAAVVEMRVAWRLLAVLPDSAMVNYILLHVLLSQQSDTRVSQDRAKHIPDTTRLDFFLIWKCIIQNKTQFNKTINATHHNITTTPRNKQSHVIRRHAWVVLSITDLGVSQNNITWHHVMCIV